MTTLPPYTPPPPVKTGRGPLFWVACGCGGCFTVIVAFVIVVYAIIVAAMRNSTPVEETVRHARANPQVVAALGEPIEPGLLFLGKLSFDNNDGAADITFTIKGPKGKARAYVVGTLDGNDGWRYDEMRVKLADDTRINLLPEPPLRPEN
ncbi:MAG TPA: cytochrome c oxidase assembly factor Coa1 family protein [Thermoanaerobaculia bacterium]